MWVSFWCTVGIKEKTSILFERERGQLRGGENMNTREKQNGFTSARHWGVLEEEPGATAGVTKIQLRTLGQRGLKNKLGVKQLRIRRPC